MILLIVKIILLFSMLQAQTEPRTYYLPFVTGSPLESVRECADYGVGFFTCEYRPGEER